MYELNIPSASMVLDGSVSDGVLAGYVEAQRFVRQPLRLHLGCGTVHFDGWVNVDIEGEPDLRLDLRFGLPFADESVELIHSEHMVEHLRLADGFLLMTEARRVLRPGGILRIGVPDLDQIVRRYRSSDWRDQEWIKDAAFDWIDTPVALINVAFRGWEHQYLYDETELHFRLGRAGFTQVRRMAWGESEVAELRARETRPETDLIVEAVK
jgi:predicted SAM-dependent methyltransferase